MSDCSFTQRVFVLYPPKWYIHSAVWLHGECRVALHSAFLYSIHRSGILTALFGYMASAMWNCCRLGACSLYAVQPRLQALVYDILEEGAGKRCFYTSMHQLTRSLYSKPLYCVFSCNLPPALLAKWPGSFLCYSGWSGYRNVSQHRMFTRGFIFIFLIRYSCRESDPRPLDHDRTYTGVCIALRDCEQYSFQLSAVQFYVLGRLRRLIKCFYQVNPVTPKWAMDLMKINWSRVWLAKAIAYGTLGCCCKRLFIPSRCRSLVLMMMVM